MARYRTVVPVVSVHLETRIISTSAYGSLESTHGRIEFEGRSLDPVPLDSNDGQLVPGNAWLLGLNGGKVL